MVVEVKKKIQEDKRSLQPDIDNTMAKKLRHTAITSLVTQCESVKLRNNGRMPNGFLRSLLKKNEDVVNLWNITATIILEEILKRAHNGISKGGKSPPSSPSTQATDTSTDADDDMAGDDYFDGIVSTHTERLADSNLQDAIKQAADDYAVAKECANRKGAFKLEKGAMARIIQKAKHDHNVPSSKMILGVTVRKRVQKQNHAGVKATMISPAIDLDPIVREILTIGYKSGIRYRATEIVKMANLLLEDYPSIAERVIAHKNKSRPKFFVGPSGPPLGYSWYKSFVKRNPDLDPRIHRSK